VTDHRRYARRNIHSLGFLQLSPQRHSFQRLGKRRLEPRARSLGANRRSAVDRLGHFLWRILRKLSYVLGAIRRSQRNRQTRPIQVLGMSPNSLFEGPARAIVMSLVWWSVLGVATSLPPLVPVGIARLGTLVVCETRRRSVPVPVPVPFAVRWPKDCVLCPRW
jgi:hypothetical protein